jgi:hypothetical protein
MNVKKTTLSVAFGIFGTVAYGGSFAFHLYTAWMANNEYGAFWGIVVFLTPPISDCYWIGKMISRMGVFNLYVACAAAVLISYCTLIFLVKKQHLRDDLM